MLAGLLPLFPLPRLVLLPGVRAGLHLFEPRYRAMAEDALATGSGFILVRANLETDTDLVPPEAGTQPVGTRVEILVHERLPDGRYNLVVRGVEAVRILEQASDRPYRVAQWQGLAEGSGDWPEPERIRLIEGVEAYFRRFNIDGLELDSEALRSIELRQVPLLASALNLALPELQFLLESGSDREMARRLGSLLRFALEGRIFPES